MIGDRVKTLSCRDAHMFLLSIPMLRILFQTRWQEVTKTGINLRYLSNKQAKNDFWKGSTHFIFLKTRTRAYEIEQ